jgi:hypothetical protein
MKNLKIAAAVAATLIAGCVSSGAVQIGPQTYAISKTNAGGAFSDAGGVAVDLMREGGAFCAQQGKQFLLVTKGVRGSQYGTTLGGADITFRCISEFDPEYARPTMRPDNGVTTTENR